MLDMICWCPRFSEVLPLPCSPMPPPPQTPGDFMPRRNGHGIIPKSPWGGRGAKVPESLSSPGGVLLVDHRKVER